MNLGKLEKPLRYPGIKEAKIAPPLERSASRSGLKYVVLIREGVPTKNFVETAKRVGLAQEEFAKKLGLKYRTIASRLSRDKRLKPEESEKVLRMQELFEQAVRVFESPEEAREWLMTPAYGLEGQRPIDLMDTGPGAAQVRDYLGAIEYGNYW